MIKTEDVIVFFDRLAPDWDKEMIKDDRVIGCILDNACVTEGREVLDVACGTGVMIPYYIERGAASVTAVDISPKMAEIAQSKYEGGRVSVICADVENYDFGKKYDCIVVYNALPHFPDTDSLIRSLSGLLKTGGVLTVAHGMSREQINKHHKGAARYVSNGLMSAEELAKIFEKYLKVTAVISNGYMYQVAGINII